MDEILKKYANLKDYGISTQDEYKELCELREKCKANEKDIVLDSYRIKLGRALNKIDALEDEITELNGEKRNN